MSGRLFSDSKNCTMLLKNLMDSVKEVQNVYGKNKTLLATEKDTKYAIKTLIFHEFCSLVHVIFHKNK